MKWFDSHCHIQLAQFAVDRDALLERMQESGTSAVVIGTDLQESRDAVALAEKYDFLWAAIGLHPNDNLKQKWLDISSQMEELARHPKVVAIGECGLDYFRLPDDKAGSGGTPEEKSAQKVRFESQIELALAVRKPLVVHCRNPLRLAEGEASAHEDMLEILADYTGNHPDLAVVLHFCTVSGDVAQKYLDLGCYLSFPGPITYTDMYDESIRVAPMDKILAETDSPFAAPVPFRGQRNEPMYVSHVVAKIALVKEMDLADVAAQIVKNSKKVFGVA